MRNLTHVLFLLSGSVFALQLTDETDYHDYYVLSTRRLKKKDLAKFNDLLTNPDYNFWRFPEVRRPVEIMVHRSRERTLFDKLAKLGLTPRIAIKNVGSVVSKERKEIISDRRKNKRKINARSPRFDRWMNLTEIYLYLDEVVKEFPEIASILEIGETFEGRPLKVLKLSTGGNKTALFVNAAMHAREWISVPAAMYLIYQLTEGMSSNKQMLDKNDFYVLLVANPDGYEYTWTTDRFWTKNRAPNPDVSCVGTDINRNFAWEWRAGFETPCSQAYPGSGPFSAEESRAYAEFVKSNPEIEMVVSIHSFGQRLLYPTGKQGSDELTDYSDAARIGQEATQQIFKANERNYKITPMSKLPESLSYGTSVDWMYGFLGKLAYRIELPSRGKYRFNPSTRSILRVARDIWKAFRVFATNLSQNQEL